MSTAQVWAVIVLGGLGTFACRAVLLLGAERFGDPGVATARVLRMIPPAALGALVAPGVLRHGGELDVLSWRLVAAAAAVLVGWRTSNVTAAVVVGLGLLTALQQLT